MILKPGLLTQPRHYPKRADDELELLTAAFLRGDANAEAVISEL